MNIEQSRRERAQSVSDNDGLAKVARELSEKKKRRGLSGLPRRSPIRLDTTRIASEPKNININTTQDNAIVTVAEQSEVSDTLQSQLNTGPSGILSTNLNPISPPEPPKIFRDIYKVAVGGYLLGRVGGEVIASGRETLRIREQARNIGAADAISKINKEAIEIWKNIPFNEKVLVFDYLKERGIDAEKLKSVELVMTFKELDKARKKKIENTTEKDSIIVKRERTETLKHKIDADIERLSERAKAITRLSGVFAYTLSSSLFRGITGLSKGIAQGFGSKPVIGGFMGAGMTVSGYKLGMHKLEYIANSILNKGPIVLDDALLFLGLTFLTFTGVQMLYETGKNIVNKLFHTRASNTS